MKNKILIIDDDPNSIALLSLILQKEGYEVLSACTSQSGIKIASNEEIDLILLDILMPDVNGFLTCKLLKENSSTKEIPIIFLSALTEAQDKIKGLEMGGVDFVTKGGDRGELLARVRIQLKINTLTRELLRANEILTDKQQRLDEDLKAAALIQHSLLPRKFLKIPGIDLAWKFHPCELIGGDIFNAVPIDEKHVAFYILDVSGHGVPSALVSASVSEVINQYCNPANSTHQNLLAPKQLLEAINSEFPIERFDRFFTLVYLVLNVLTGEMWYANAGHPAPILLKKNGKQELLEMGGPLIGLGQQYSFEQDFKTLEKGDKIIFYTDGITESQDRSGIFFGEEKFYTLLHQLRGHPINTVVDEVYEQLLKYIDYTSPKDDVSLLGFEFI